MENIQRRDALVKWVSVARQYIGGFQGKDREVATGTSNKGNLKMKKRRQFHRPYAE